MSILDRYVASHIVFATLTVMGVLLALFTFFAFADELGDTGKGTYGAYEALVYSVSMMPGMAYDLFPSATLIGTMMGLGTLAGNSELTAMRASGYSLAKLVRGLLRLAVLLMLLVFAIGEWLAPMAQQYGETLRSLAQSQKVSLQTKTGLWVRDGSRVINIGEMLAGGHVRKLNIYEIDQSNQLSTVTQADDAFFQIGQNQWRLHNYQQYRLSEQGVQIQREKQVDLDTMLSPAMLDVVVVEPSAMSIVDLYHYVDYLQANGLESRKYQQAMWSKIVSPLSTLVMVLLAIPFIFGSTRTMTAGHRILIGTMVGIGFYLLSQVFGYVGLVFEINPVIAAMTPTVVFLLAALHLLRRVR
ncbi:MAG: LPS export ABC transporter permease LptG [Gammaproteobacteria bacterium]|nr:LPS export ABC transporter permease LptG [Gammaproteobacteria bacterium]